MMAQPTEILLCVVSAVVLAGLLWPRWGLVSWWRGARRRERRERMEDALKHLYESELNGTPASLQSVAWATQLSGDQVTEVLQSVERRGLIDLEGDAIRLTPPGRELGLHVLRAHRLWESYLADRTGFPETEWHGRAHELEHGLSAAEVEALSARLHHPTHDPHGDPIPTADGEAEGPAGIPLVKAPLGQALRIAHIEDEPDAVYAQLVASGLYPGMVIELREVSSSSIRLAGTAGERVIEPLAAANVAVVPLPHDQGAEAAPGETLTALRPGESGRVTSLAQRCRGAERRRLMDLGVLPGTVIRAELRSPSGDPTAYWIRGALIALRVEQSDMIWIERLPSKETAEAAA
jgi:DtxR family Mn-dependent transcriptional regulator